MSKKIIHEVKNSGFIHEEPPKEDYRALLGSVSGNIGGDISPLKEPPTIFENGTGWKNVWDEYDMAELQFNRKFDTYSCVVYGIAKAICLYVYKVYNIKITISEMYNSFFADVIPNAGTSISKGFRSFYRNGWISDEKYPFTPETTAKEFFAHPPKEICIEAEGTLLKFNFHYEVLANNIETIFEAYRKTPVVLSGFAWMSYAKSNVYFDDNRRANHVFLGLEQLINGNNLISDTYPKDFKFQNKSELDSEELLKELDSSFKYGSAHRCWVTPKKTTSILIKIINMLKKIGRDINGGIYFIKEGKKQKIETGFQGFAALVDELGIDPKKNNLTNDQLSLLKDYKFFGK